MSHLPNRPTIADLGCSAGGMSMGFYRAGFNVVGVDIEPQPNYPFEFHQMDMFDFLAAHGHEFDALSGSPPCQAYGITAHLPQVDISKYPKLIAPLRNEFDRIGRPYVIENVVGAPIQNGIKLCGLMFGLKVFRHRLFESNILMLAPPHIPHGSRRIGKDGFCCVVGGGDAGKDRKIDAYHRRKATWQAAMGIDWMNKREMTQAIPPAYSEFVGRQLIAAI